jgi:hypothetical protein
MFSWGPPPRFRCPCVPVGAMLDVRKGWANNPVWLRRISRPWECVATSMHPYTGMGYTILASCGVEGFPL